MTARPTAKGGAWTGRVMRMLQVATDLVLLNLLVLGGAIVGLGVLGVMPALVAAAAVLLGGRGGDGIVRVFVRAYRAEFRRANLAGVPFGIIVLLLTADAVVLPRITGPFGAVLLVLTITVAGVSAVSAVATVTLLCRYDDRPRDIVRHACALTLTNPGAAASVLVTLVAATVVCLTFPVLVPLVGASAPLALAVRLIDRRLPRAGAAHPPLEPATAR